MHGFRSSNQPANGEPLRYTPTHENGLAIFGVGQQRSLPLMLRNRRDDDVWLTVVNGSSTTGPQGFVVTGPYEGDTYAVPSIATIPAQVYSWLSGPFQTNLMSGRAASLSVGILPTNETITCSQPCYSQLTAQAATSRNLNASRFASG
jgi:hypothetical protein